MSLDKTPVLLIAPETGRLPEDMGTIARYISGKSGGLGEVVAALCAGLTKRGIECHIATLNLKKRFQKECGLDEKQWREVRYRIDPDRVHLVSSSIFADLPSAYAGNPLETAAEFQRCLVNQIIKDIRAKNGGRIIIHSHDWMAGGVITAYAKSRGCPILHTVHNVHTGHIPVEKLVGVNIAELSPFIYFSHEYGRTCVDAQSTAIKNASLINFVGCRFLEEVVNDYFQDRPIISPSLRREIKEKYRHGQTLTILNAPAPGMYPETCLHLARNYGPEDDLLAAKGDNRVEFQRRTGLQEDPDRILFYWPSRLDPNQKGVELLEEVALRFINTHPEAQIAVIGDGIGRDTTHEEIMGRIAWASGGKICYHRFREDLSMLGYAAANDVFGASLYEPCGQIDQIGNLFGTTATNRDTGGYHDKIRDLQISTDGTPEDCGNGFLFRDYDINGLWYGLEKSLSFHRQPREVRAKQMRRIMIETRSKYDLDRMIDQYVAVYERLCHVSRDPA